MQLNKCSLPVAWNGQSVERTFRLEQEVSERRRGETLQRALFEISALSARGIDLDAFYLELHRILGGLLYAKNLIVTLYHELENQISFPYLADEKDPAPPRDFRRPPGHGLTGFVTDKQTSAAYRSGSLSSIGGAGRIAQCAG